MLRLNQCGPIPVILVLLVWFVSPVAGQSSWSPTVSLGLARLLVDSDGAVTGGPALGSVAGRLQLLRVSEGSFAWGIEAGYYRWGRFSATAECVAPSCTEPVTTEYSDLSGFEAGLAARFGTRGGRTGVYGTAGLNVAVAIDSDERDTATGPGASLGAGYVVRAARAQRIFVELTMHGFVVAAPGGAGYAMHGVGLVGIAF